MDSHEHERIHVSVASTAGAHTVGNASFFHYILRLAEHDVVASGRDREALDILALIPHAFESNDELRFVSGRGWRVVPPSGDLDWAVLEATPQRLRTAFESARRLLWSNAGRFSVSAREMTAIEEELDAVYAVLTRAEAAGVSVNVTYVA